MDATTLRAVLHELRPQLVPARFEKARQSDGATVQMALRTLDGLRWLELSWLAEAPRLHTVDPPPRGGEGSTLAQQLQHGLRGLALVALAQQGWERVVELVFARRPGEPPQRSLVLELMGRHSNLFLLDGERRVVALARQVRPEQSRLRPIATGDPYTPPPPMAGVPPRRSESEESWRDRLLLVPLPLGRALREAYQGIGPALVRQLAATALGDGGAGEALLQRLVTELEPAQWSRLRGAWQGWLEAVEEERFALRLGAENGYRCWEGSAGPGPAQADAPADPLAINHGLAAYYGRRLEERELARRRGTMRQRLQAALAREERSVGILIASLEAAAGSEELQRSADALLCLPDPGRERIDEAQKLYRQARKLRRSVAAVTPLLAEHRARAEALEASLTYLEQAGCLADLAELEEEFTGLVPAGAPGGGRRASRAAGPPRPLELRSPGGLRLQVGRNHRQNEWISLRHGRRGDLWFHAQECPGSHVVLKGSEQPPAEGDLSAAADLAAHFSRGRGNARVPVVMVPVETLQRIPGAPPGTVRHRGGRVLWGVPERGRVLLEPPNLSAEAPP